MAKFVPPVADVDGGVVKISFAAAAGETVTVVAVLVNAPSVAVMVYVPTLARLQFENVATPATAAFGFVVQTMALPPPPEAVRVTLEVLPVTRLPPASSTDTEGCVANPAALTAFADGTVVKTNLLAAPVVMVTGSVSVAKVPSEAVIV
jgi:hypothetical protein